MAGGKHESQNEADHQRDSGHDLEIDKRFDPDATNLLEIAGAGDTVHHDAKHDRRDDHGDEFEKAITQDLQAGRKIGCHDADHDAEQQRDQDLDKQRFVKW